MKVPWAQLKDFFGLDGVEPDQIIEINGQAFRFGVVHEDGVTLVPEETDEEE